MNEVDKIMLGAGFSPTDTGPWVTKLREMVERMVRDEGLARMSGGTWASDDLTAEERARGLWEMETAVRKGYSYRVECLDPPIWWQHRFRDGKWSKRLRVNWMDIPAWLGDRWREFQMHRRIQRDKRAAA